MSGFRAFTRQLGYQPGVQLNPLQDQTDGVALDNSDQIVAAIGRFTRGRIDKPFSVTASNLLKKTGPSEAIRINSLNETKLQIYEALQNGAVGAVLQRLVPAAAAKSYVVINFSGTPTETLDEVAYSVSSTIPTTGYSMYLMHHDCFNDGIKVSIHADQTPLGGTYTANDAITLRVSDVDGNVIHEFSGSLDPTSVDDYGNSDYLPDVIEKYTESLTLVVASNAKVPVTSNAYGRALDGSDNWATSGTLVCFSEGGTTYAATDLDRCITALKNTQLEFGYLLSGGSQNISLLGKLGALGIDINIPVKIDVPGSLDPAEAITWVNSLNFDSHLIHYNWCPLTCDDPMNGGRATWGAGGLQAGYSCSRNARVNAKGFAPKNYPIAGKDWPLNRVNVRQVYTPEEYELSDLARAKINPVIYDVYNGGGKYVFTDSLTSAKSLVSYRKLQNVAEMSITIDTWVSLQSKALLQQPMKQFMKQMDRFMARLFESAQASEWLVPAKNLAKNAAYAYTIEKSEVKPADTVNITYWVSYDGVARQVFLQQVLVN